MKAPRIQFPHCYASLDPAVRREIVQHAATDGYPLTGVLHQPPGRDADVVVLAMHPRVDFSHHYLVPGLVGGGYAFMGSTTRYLHHDADALHERLLLDVAGSIGLLRERGFRRVVLLGNSGGGSLFAFYLEQADPELRAHTEEIAQRLARAGASVAEVKLPESFKAVLAAHRIVMHVEAAAVHAELFRCHAELYRPKLRATIEAGSLIPGVSYVQAQRIRRQFRHDMQGVFQRVDCLLAPAAPGPAPHDLTTTGDAFVGDEVDVGKHLRPNWRGGRIVLIVAPPEDAGMPWRAEKLD